MTLTEVSGRPFMRRLLLSFAYVSCIAGIAGLASTIDSSELGTFRIDVEARQSFHPPAACCR